MSIAIHNTLIPDFNQNAFVKASVKIEQGIITEISDTPMAAETVIDGIGNLLSPGLIDCHCHIESSLLPPDEFGNTVLKFGTLHIVADCHEITNVAGPKGLEYFMESAKNTPCNIKFALPSSVPATPFATSGGTLSLNDIETMMASSDVVALGEIMNIPAAIAHDPTIMGMINIAKQHHKRINGHAPHLDKTSLQRYISIGVEDDHESETYEELKQKIEAGLNVFLREGTAEHTENAAYRIIKEHPNRVMFCTDDKSIHHILETGHINYHLKKAVLNGITPFAAIKSASYNGLIYYGLKQYAEIKVGNPASLVLFEDMINFIPKLTLIDGVINPQSISKINAPKLIRNSFSIQPITAVPAIPDSLHHIGIKVTDGSLITDKMTLTDHNTEFDIESDILKMVVFERYGNGRSAAAKVHGFDLKRGAIASSVAHDCHNIIVVGTSDTAIQQVVNAIIEENGGLAVTDGENVTIVPLHIGGIVSDQPAEKLSQTVEELKKAAQSLGCSFTDPFATLSFMALEVIPHIKLTDRGLFDVDTFSHYS